MHNGSQSVGSARPIVAIRPEFQIEFTAIRIPLLFQL